MAKAPRFRSTYKRPPPSITPTTTVPPKAPPYPPFSPPPTSSFQTLLSTFPTQHIYILHLDTHGWGHRLLIFTLPFLFNTTLLFLLAWRAYTILPTYLSILLATLGYQTEHSFDFSSAGTGEVGWLVMERMGLFFFDGVLLGRVVAEWPVEFFWGGRLGSVAFWRWKVGVLAGGREVVVRRSRRWADGVLVVMGGKGVRGDLEEEEEWGREWWGDDDDDDGDGSGEGGKRRKEALEKISKAVRREWVNEKTGLLMIDKDWDLYYRGMVDAHSLIDRGELEFKELEKGPVVAVWSHERGWLVWRPWEDGGKGEGMDKRREGEAKLRLFKDILTSVGKEGLFFRWVELMQDENRRWGGKEGFTRERRVDVIRRNRQLFEEMGVDWDEVIQGIGGVDGLPGMEITT